MAETQTPTEIDAALNKSHSITEALVARDKSPEAQPECRQMLDRLAELEKSYPERIFVLGRGEHRVAVLRTPVDRQYQRQNLDVTIEGTIRYYPVVTDREIFAIAMRVDGGGRGEFPANRRYANNNEPTMLEALTHQFVPRTEEEIFRELLQAKRLDAESKGKPLPSSVSRKEIVTEQEEDQKLSDASGVEFKVATNGWASRRLEPKLIITGHKEFLGSQTVDRQVELDYHHNENPLFEPEFTHLTNIPGDEAQIKEVLEEATSQITKPLPEIKLTDQTHSLSTAKTLSNLLNKIA